MVKMFKDLAYQMLARKEIEKKKLGYTAGGNVKYHNRFAKQFLSFLRS